MRFEPDLGPVLNVGLARPYSLLSEEQKKTPPLIKTIKLLVDTGASMTSFSPKVAQELDLPVLGKVGLKSVTHIVSANQYLADLIWTVGTPFPITDMKLMEFPMADDAIDGLLGRDIICQCLLHLNGPDKTLTLAH
jgi:hypothetical protein